MSALASAAAIIGEGLVKGALSAALENPDGVRALMKSVGDGLRDLSTPTATPAQPPPETPDVEGEVTDGINNGTLSPP